MSTPSLAWLQRLAQQAGHLIRHEQQTLTISYKDNIELVTQADVAADRLIQQAIQEQFPSHTILSEELAPQAATECEYLWIVDPIDGTVNFARGHSQVAVSIAFYRAGMAELGVVYNPFTQELFSAQAGQGATLNGEPIHCSGTDELRRALIATGFPYQKNNLGQMIERLQKVLTHCADVRRLGSAALDICWVACGRLDGYYESVKPWDFAAARLIALEAGAVAGHYLAPPADISPTLCGDHILVSNAVLFEAMQSLLTDH